MGYRVELLGQFRIVDGRGPLELNPASARLVACLACSETAVGRSAVAERLWPELPPGHAASRLRSTLWRLGRRCPGLLRVTPQRIGLAPAVAVDVATATALAWGILDGRPGDDAPLRHDVLPEWEEDWVDAERSRFRQLRLHALERLAVAHTDAGRFALAIDLASAAVRAEPLRETPHRVLIAAHLREGNQVEAMRAYERCRAGFADELGIPPSAALRALVGLQGGHVGAADAPVHQERRRGDEARVVARQERDGGGDLLRLREPPHRHVHQPPLRPLGVGGEQLPQQRRVHGAGA